MRRRRNKINAYTYKTVDISPGDNVTVLLNVTDDDLAKAYRVNVTANSTGNSSKVDYINTTTRVIRPDLNVMKITPNCGYLFGNESNEICAEIKNIGTNVTGPFNVSFIADGFSEEVRVDIGLAVGATTTLCVTDSTLRKAGDSVTIDIIADCNNEVTESDETNNASSNTTIVVNNGYKGKTYTGGVNMTTWKSFELNGSVLYSHGDSYYLSGGTNWTQYVANWTASNLSVPSTATVREARLYVPYTWSRNKTGNYGVYPEFNMSFNSGTNVTMENVDGNYTDRKGFEPGDYPYGMLAYNVTGAFNPSGPNNTTIFHLRSFPYQVSMQGMQLVVRYADDNEPMRNITVNEEFDLLNGKSSYYCATPAEATAYATIGAIDTTKWNAARLITFAPDAGPNEGDLIFNDHIWTDVWNKAGSTGIGISENTVTPYLESTDNVAGFRSSATSTMEASNAILVLESLPAGVSAEYAAVVDLAVTFIDATVNETVEGITFTEGTGSVTAKTYTDDPTGTDPVGTGVFDTGFGYFSIDVDPSLNASATITFKVPLADITAAGLTTSDVALYHYSGGVWNKLSTTYLGTTAGYARFTATVSHFSYLVIGGTAAPAAAPRRPGGGARVVAPPMNVPVDPTTGTVTSTTTLTVEKATLTFPKGTIVKDAEGNPLATSITTLHSPTTAEKVGAIKAYDFGPSGTTFAPSIDLVIEYDPADIPAGFSEEDLVVNQDVRWHSKSMDRPRYDRRHRSAHGNCKGIALLDICAVRSTTSSAATSNTNANSGAYCATGNANTASRTATSKAAMGIDHWHHHCGDNRRRSSVLLLYEEENVTVKQK